MRLFVAIEIPGDICRYLAKVQDSLRDAIDAKWTPPEQMHLTLKFLGETPDVELSRIVDELKTIQFEPVELSTQNIVFFPPHGPIRIVAVELGDENGKCAALQQQIDDACHAAGFKLEGRKWTPHVTLARVKKRLPHTARDAASTAAMARAEFWADEFVVTESRLDRNGPEYFAVARFTSEPK